MFESIKRVKKFVKVDMKVVYQLLEYQREQGCDMHPRIQKTKCKQCLHYKQCHHYKWERDFIISHHDSKKTSKQREKRMKKEELLTIFSEFDDCEEDNYPCDPFNFTCPDRDRCKGHCMWLG